MTFPRRFCELTDDDVMEIEDWLQDYLKKYDIEQKDMYIQQPLSVHNLKAEQDLQYWGRHDSKMLDGTGWRYIKSFKEFYDMAKLDYETRMDSEKQYSIFMKDFRF